MNLRKMRHQVRRAEAHSPDAPPWALHRLALNRQVEQLAQMTGIPADVLATKYAQPLALWFDETLLATSAQWESAWASVFTAVPGQESASV